MVLTLITITLLWFLLALAVTKRWMLMRIENPKVHPTFRVIV
ncbi:secreted protein, partial [gut metagenome]